jgi:deoxyribonuclease-1-like protein
MKTAYLGLLLSALLIGGCSTQSPPRTVTSSGEKQIVRSLAAPTLRVATFNIQDFGNAKIGKSEITAVLADIVRSYDVVAVQEISDVSGQVPLKFLKIVNSKGAKYGLVLSQRSGQQADDEDGAEQYAFYYNTRTVQAQDQGALYPDGGSDDFQREPFVAGFTSVKGNVRFVLITVHTKPEASRKEIPALAKTLAWARGRFVDQDGFVLLGDFNASGTYASGNDLSRWRANELPYTWIVPDSADTNVSPDSARAYDRIIATDQMARRFTGQWSVDRVFTEKKVSDHWPVWAEFTLLPLE